MRKTPGGTTGRIISTHSVPLPSEGSFTPLRRLSAKSMVLWGARTPAYFSAAGMLSRWGLSPVSLVQLNKDACPLHDTERITHLTQKPDVIFNFTSAYDLKSFYYTGDPEFNVCRKVHLCFRPQTSNHAASPCMGTKCTPRKRIRSLWMKMPRRLYAACSPWSWRV